MTVNFVISCRFRTFKVMFTRLPKYVLLFLFLLAGISFAQSSSDILFSEPAVNPSDPSDLLTLRLEIPIKTLRKETNDSTFTSSTLYFKKQNNWDSLPVELRTRGEFRRKKCIFPPVKIKFSKKDIENTLFDSNRKLKLVVPCRHEEAKNDNVVKEYLAYKLYEPVTPYHFKTRLVNLEWSQKASKKKSGHQLKAILLEDLDHLADRVGGDAYDRNLHPMRLDTLNGIRNAFFQYMIGNADYSVTQGHNYKIIYDNEKFLVIPYDFDLAGLVNADYGKSSDVQNLRFMGDQPAARVYRDFPRDPALVQEVREEYLAHKDAIFHQLEKTKGFFDNEDEYAEAELYLTKFFQVLEDDKKFNRIIINSN